MPVPASVPFAAIWIIRSFTGWLFPSHGNGHRLLLALRSGIAPQPHAINEGILKARVYRQGDVLDVLT